MTEEESALLPLLCRKGGPDKGADLVPVYVELRQHWQSRNPGKTLRMLAATLGEDPQKVTQWATGSGTAKLGPPWRVIMHLCHLLGFVVVMHPEGPILYQDPDVTAAANGAPANEDPSGGKDGS